MFHSTRAFGFHSFPAHAGMALVIAALPVLPALAQTSTRGAYLASPSTASATTGTTTTATSSRTVASTALNLSPCQPSGLGSDYTVGPGQRFASLDQVPWESLKAGDTVRIFPAATAYKGKFVITARGTASAPVRICGVRAADGSRPVIDGSGATTRAALHNIYATSDYARDIHQDRSLVLIKAAPAQGWTAFPSWIQIDGLKITRGHPDQTFTNAAGAQRRYAAFGACIWVERGQNISILDNEIADCQMAVFSKSTDDGDFAVTRNLRIAGNRFAGHGIVGDVHQHTTYTQSIGTTIEFNIYAPLRNGSPGNAIKDRSAGTVVRYNRLEEGSHALDLVEAEDFPLTAMATPAYRSTLVYGNQIIKTGDSGSVVHYGGDHFGSQPGAGWGEPIFRKGTLHFFHNTLYLKGTTAWVFQVSTTEERVEAWNNAIHFAPTVAQKNLRMEQDVVAPWVGGGIVNLGRNWITTGWQDSDVWHKVRGQLLGTGLQVGGTAAPFDVTTLQPGYGSALIDAAAGAPVSMATTLPLFQFDRDLLPQVRRQRGAASDLGAFEY